MRESFLVDGAFSNFFALTGEAFESLFHKFGIHVGFDVFFGRPNPWIFGFEVGVTHVEPKVNSIGVFFSGNGAFSNFCSPLVKAFFNKLEIDDAIDYFSAISGLGILRSRGA